MLTLRGCLLMATHLPFGGGIFLLLFLFQLCLVEVASAAPTTPDLKAIETASSNSMDFVPPKPGSYELFRIMTAADGKVLDIEGRRKHLAQFTGGKVTLLSFIYSTCADPNGCPYAYVVFHNLKNRLEREPKLHGRVRLVSLSFDPKRDTPEMLKLYAGDNARPNQPVEWDFLTTTSYKDLMPILDDFGQDVFVEVDPITQKPLGTLSHVLKVFLVDQDHVVREVYTTVYLQPEMVYNDILTLLMEQGLKFP